MSENTEYPTGTTGDPDADPDMLAPRTGDEASGSQTEDPGTVDPDSDPSSLDPRGDA